MATQLQQSSISKNDRAKAKDQASKSALQAVADKQKKIQQAQDAKDQKKLKKTGGAAPEKKAMQAGARSYPELPLPSQHLQKPGSELTWNCSRRSWRPATRAAENFRA